MFQPIIYTTDNLIEAAPLPANGKDYTLEELYAILGCDDIQVIIIEGRGGPFYLFFDEEGKLKGLPINHLATDIAHYHGVIASDDYLVGKVLYCHHSMIR